MAADPLDAHSLPMVRDEARDNMVGKWSPMPLMSWIWLDASGLESRGGVVGRERSVGLRLCLGSGRAEETVLIPADVEISSSEGKEGYLL